MTRPDTHRADRLHAIWQRRAARFREAHYAYRLASDVADFASRDSLAYQQARDLVRSAMRRMDILNRQTMRLARLQIAAAGLAATVATAPATAADDWTDSQTDKAIALATLVGVNWAQEHTRARQINAPATGKYIPGQPGRAYAASYQPTTQPASSPEASGGDVGRVNREFLLGIAVGALLLDALPTRYRDTALQAGLVISASCVGNNLRLGVGIKF